MAIKKSELYSTIWKSCDELRGGMDASQYKDYVLVLLFAKYVSDKYAGDPKALIEVPVGGGFADMVAAKGDKEIGDRINKIIGRLADANESLKGAINVADFNDEEKLGKGKEMVDRLTKLVAIFEQLEFGGNKIEGDDLLGDAYEYLMRHFATESGKSKGQFYTPAEVSRVMAMVIDLGKASNASQSVYDPTCGSGSLLLKAHDEAKSRTGLDLALYGQEMDNATSALARMNMVLHDCPTAEIWPGNSVSAPHFKNPDGGLKTVDYAVANPPFSNKNWTSGLDAANDLYGRFEFGIPPAKNGDYAFLLHLLKSLKSTGKGAIIMPHGVLFRGGAEAGIRTRVVKQGYIKGIVGLPANLFYGTGVRACILVLDKEGAAGRKGIFMIDASKGFIKDGNKNRLRAQDIHKIVDTFTRQAGVPKYSRMVPLSEIEANDFKLDLPRYIDSTDPDDLQDVEAHMKGGIPNRDLDGLEAYWKAFPSLRGELFANSDRAGYSEPKVATAKIKAAIFGHPEFTAFNEHVGQLFAAWKSTSKPLLSGIKKGDRPKAVIEAVSEDLLEIFRAAAGVASLIDPYGVYQHLMDYWTDIMLDDAWMIASDGWKSMPDGKPNTDLIPPVLIVGRFFADDQAAIDQFQGKYDAVRHQIEELEDEHGGEEGLLTEARTDKGKLTAKSVKDRLKAIAADTEAIEEREVLSAHAALVGQKAFARKKVNDGQKALESKVPAKYQHLSEADMKTLVVDDKWLASLAASVQRESDDVSQTLAGRVRQLSERYAVPLPLLADAVEDLSARVSGHIEFVNVHRYLSGHIRLPGFTGTWKKKRLGNLLSYEHPTKYLVDSSEYSDRHDVPVLTAGTTFVLGYTNETTGIFKDVPAIIFDDFTTAIQYVTFPFKAKSSAMKILKPRDANVDLKFVFEAMRLIRFQVGDHKRHWISEYEKLEIMVPDPNEQSALSAFISDFESQVAALKTLREKHLALKQGMVEELLTGWPE